MSGCNDKTFVNSHFVDLYKVTFAICSDSRFKYNM